MEVSVLVKIIDDHKKWIKKEGGKRANFSCEDLRFANLRGANLEGADLSGVDLEGAKIDL